MARTTFSNEFFPAVRVWDVVQKYSPGILIGNWAEDRLGKFQLGNYVGNSTHKVDFQKYSSDTYHPDVSSRRRGLLRNHGLSKKELMVHHGERYMQNFISSYDQDYIRNYHSGIRRWDRHRIMWTPEKSDHPLTGSGTNYGLKEAKLEEWKKLDKIRDFGDYDTLYALNYVQHPLQKRSVFAIPRHLSVHLHPHNMHKNLHFRGKPLVVRPETVELN